MTEPPRAGDGIAAELPDLEAIVEEAAAVEAVPASLVVSAESFTAFDFEAPIAGFAQCDAYGMSDTYQKAAKAAEAAGQVTELKVFGLLAGICSIMLHVEDRGDPWGPMWTSGDQRSAIPSDFRGAQSAVLEQLLPAIKHPALRARLADIVWTNDRTRGQAARVAVEAYCECAEGLLSGTFHAAYEAQNRASFEVIDVIGRALTVAYLTSKKIDKRVQFSARLTDAWKTLYDLAVKDAAFVVFIRTATLGLRYEIADAATVALDCERLAGSAEPGKYPMAVQGVWDLGAHLHEGLQDQVARRRCLIGSLNQTLAMRKQVSSAGAEAHWVMKALQALHHISEMDELEAELERDLRRLQKASLKEMKPFSYEIDVTEDRAKTQQLFSSLGLSDGLLKFALLVPTAPRDELRKAAIDGLKASPLSSLFGAVHLDEHGKSIVQTPSASGNEQPDEAWFQQEINRLEGPRRIQIVGAAIEPARSILSARFGVGERHFHAIVGRSPFVPQSHEPLLALGFARFFQGDFMSAVHLLVPQVEPCLRFILRLNGLEPVKRRDDGTEEDLDLVGMLSRMRPELEKIFNADIVDEIERLFTSRPGPALRHDVAHGQVGGWACYSADPIYACWFIYRLCVLFIAGEWKQIIAPELALAGY